MPHMMPMSWLFMFMFSLTMYIIITMMLHFFYLPKTSFKKNIKITFKKWIWKW